MTVYFNLYEDWETGLKKIGGLQHKTMHDALGAAKNALSKHLSILVIDPETLTIRTVWRAAE